MDRPKKKWRPMVTGILVVILVACVAIIVKYQFDQYQAEQEYARLQEQVKVELETEGQEMEEPMVETEPEPVDIPVDFEALWEVNPEIYAWITIPGTTIDYPVLQRPEDDAYYLNHNIDGTAGRPGVIYSEGVNSTNFSDFNTVLYGHNMRNGTMFADLHLFENREFLEEHHQIIIYTPEHSYTYEIFAAVVYDDRHIMHSFTFEKEAGCQAYLDAILNARDMRNQYRTEQQVTTEDQLITLSTCVRNEENRRYLVVGVLTEQH